MLESCRAGISRLQTFQNSRPFKTPGLSKLSDEFQTDKPGGLRNRDQVTPPQTLRLRDETKEPFETMLLHPDWSPPQFAGVHVKGSSHSYHHRDFEFFAVFVHPALLLGSAQAHPEDIGRCLIYARRDFPLLLLCEWAERRNVDSRHHDAMPFLKNTREVLRHSTCT